MRSYYALSCLLSTTLTITALFLEGGLEWRTRQTNRLTFFPTVETRAEMHNKDSELRFDATDVRHFLEEVNRRQPLIKAGWASFFPQYSQCSAQKKHLLDFVAWLSGIEPGVDRAVDMESDAHGGGDVDIEISAVSSSHNGVE
jgi:hypothetical protein